MTPRPASHGYRLALAFGVAAVVLVAAGLALSHVKDVSTALDLGETRLAVLDTVAVDGRIVTAHVGGVVQAIGPDENVWIGTADHAFALRGVEDDSLRLEERVLVSGRVRESGTVRWLDVEALTRVASVTLGVGRRSGEQPTVQPED